MDEANATRVAVRGPDKPRNDEGDAMMHLPLGRAAFWRPSLVDGPNEASFLPLLFWLVEDGRPRLAMRIGLYEAQGFAAICAAAEVGGPGIRCRAAAQAEDPGHRAAATQTGRHYSFAEIVEMSADAAFDALGVGEAGLLSIDPQLPAAAFDALMPDPWSKIAPDGAIVIAGIPQGAAGQMARAFVDAAGKDRGRFDLTDAEGRIATVLLSDPARTPEARFGQAVAAALLAALARLGDGPNAHWQAATTRRRLSKAAAQAEAEITELTAARDERHEACATAIVQLADEQRARTALEAKAKVCSSAEDEMRTLHEELRASQRANAQRYRETAALTMQLMKGEAVAKRQKDEAVTLAKRLKGETATLEKNLSNTKKERDAILASSFWRATVPARRTVDALRALYRIRGK